MQDEHSLAPADQLAGPDAQINGQSQHSDPSIGCQNIVILGRTLYAGSLGRIWKLPRRHFVATTKQDTARGCQKSFFSFDSGALAKDIQCDTPQDLTATLKKLYLTADLETLVTWGELHILDHFQPKKTRGTDWRLPDKLQKNHHHLLISQIQYSFDMGREKRPPREHLHLLPHGYISCNALIPSSKTAEPTTAVWKSSFLAALLRLSLSAQQSLTSTGGPLIGSSCACSVISGRIIIPHRQRRPLCVKRCKST